MRIDGIVIIVDRDINDIDDNSDNSDNNDISDISVINDGNDNDVIIVGIIWIGWSGYRFLILSVLNLVSMGVEISYSKSYFRLDAWVLANVVQLATQSFFRRFVSFHDDPRRRLFDQMVMAARSAVANIAEGSARHNTSVETEMRLTDVARASVDELFGDYFNFLMSRNLSVWDKDSEHTGSVWWMVIDRPQYGADQLADVARHILVQKSKFDYYIEGDDAGMAANCLLLLCERLNRMLQRMMESQLKYFKQNGGFTEKMTQTRLEARRGQAANSPLCPICGKRMFRRMAKKGVRNGKEFWSCSDYPKCSGIRNID